MSGFRKAYFTTMAIFGVLTGAFMIPDLALIAVVLSFGLLLPLIFWVVNVFIYGLCLLPLAIFGWPGGIVSIGLAAALAFLPGWQARSAFAEIAKNAVVSDVSASQPVAAPSTVSLVNVSQSVRIGLTANISQAGNCDRFCAALLLGGNVQTVTVEVPDGLRQMQINSYELINDRIVERDGVPPEPELIFWVEAEKDRLSFGAPPTTSADTDFTFQALTRVTVTSASSGHSLASEPVLRRTNVVASLPTRPSRFSPAFAGLTSGGNNGGISIMAESVDSHPFTLWDVANDLGIPVIAYETASEEAARLRAERRTEQNTQRSAAFARARDSVYAIYADIPHPDAAGPKAGEIRLWLRTMASRSAPLSDLDRSVIQKILDSDDRRFDDVMHWFFWRDDTLAKQFFPRLIAELQADAPQNDVRIASMLTRLHHGDDYQEEFEKYADQIAEIMQSQLAADPGAQNLNLVSAAYRFDIDERPFMVAFPTGADKAAFIKWAAGLCLLPDRKLAQYNDDILRRIEPVFLNEASPEVDGMYRDIFRYLNASGYDEELRALLQTANIGVDRSIELNVFEFGNAPAGRFCAAIRRE